jgi:hypothetical protein
VRGCKAEVEKQCYVSNISPLAVGMSRISGGKDIVRPVFINYVSGLDSLWDLRKTTCPSEKPYT